MGWNMRPRRIPILGSLLTANVSLLKAAKNVFRPADEDEQVVSWTTKVGPRSYNTRTRRPRWAFPFGIYHTGKKRR